jgi:SAM-dependent methyltransferase
MTSESIAFDRAAGYYDETRGFPPGEEKQIAELISRAGGYTAQSRVLEIGVGTGRIALPLAAHVGALIGIDLSRAMLGRLRAKQSREPVHVVQADATRLPFASHVFDAAVAVHVFHLIPNWQGVLNELARALRPGGRVIHGWSDGDPVFKELWEAWRAAIPSKQAEDVGVRWEKNPTALAEQGWHPVGEGHTYSYHYAQRPAMFMERLRNRIWSQTWRLTDEELAIGVQAVQEVLRRDFPNADEPLQVTANFHVRAYTPPIVR